MRRLFEQPVLAHLLHVFAVLLSVVGLKLKASHTVGYPESCVFLSARDDFKGLASGQVHRVVEMMLHRADRIMLIDQVELIAF